MDEMRRAKRAHIVNETLVRLMSQRIASECSDMFSEGATADQVNECLPRIIEHYDCWREATLQTMMAQFDDLFERPSAALRMH